MVVAEKKKIEINGRLQYPVTVGERAVIFDVDGNTAITTSIVQEIELISVNQVAVETMNSRYIVHQCTDESQMKPTPPRKKWFARG